MNTIMFPRLTGICAGWVREHLEEPQPSPTVQRGFRYSREVK